MNITVLIVDDQEVIRTGLAALFRQTAIGIVAEASSGSQAVRKLLKAKPDVVLLDVSLGGDVDGFACLERIRAKSPATPVVMLSAHDNPTYIARSVALGASDYLLKDSSRQDLIAAITGAAKGEEPSATGAMRPISAILHSQTVEDDVPLTKRETQVLRHIAFGLSNKDIAESLNISVETVKEHVQNILRKLDVVDRTYAAVWALRMNLV